MIIESENAKKSILKNIQCGRFFCAHTHILRTQGIHNFKKNVNMLSHEMGLYKVAISSRLLTVNLRAVIGV